MCLFFGFTCRQSKGKQHAQKLAADIYERLGPRCTNALQAIKSSSSWNSSERVCFPSETKLNAFDLFAIAHIARIVILVARRLSSTPTLCELVRLKSFLTGHLPSILRHVSAVCLQVVAPFLISAVSSMTSAAWIVETDSADNAQRIIRSAAYETLYRGRQLFQEFGGLRNLMMNRDSGGDNFNVLDEILCNREEVVDTLRSGRTGIEPSKEEPQHVHSALKNELALLDIDRFVGWRSASALSYCSKLAQTLTLGEVVQAKNSVMLLQQLYSGWRDVDAFVMNEKSVNTNVELKITQYRWNFLFDWISSMFGTLKIGMASHVKPVVQKHSAVTNVLNEMKDIVHELLWFKIGSSEDRSSFDERLLKVRLLLKSEIDALTLLVTEKIEMVQDQREDLIGFALQQFGLPLLQLIDRFIAWVVSIRENDEIELIRKQNKLEKLWSILMCIAGCWRLHSGRIVLGGKALLDTFLTIQKEQMENRKTDFEHQVKFSIRNKIDLFSHS